MLFSSLQFFAFLPVMLAAFWLAPHRFRKWILLAGSYYFYASWNLKFVPLLLSLTAIDYSAALWINRTEGPKRRLALCISIGANLLFLGFFKYYNFAAANVALLAGRPADSFALNILLPLGISFHTFQSISYVVDVYRGQQKPVRSLVDYALFICFFPQLVAGPIVRAWQFFRDYYDWRPPSATEIQRGILLIILGLTKKLALADQFAQISDAYFADVAAKPGLLDAWTGSFAFAFQVFFDFSGYSDMAIGMALLFGFRFPENFRRPFLATCVTDLWRRWHMTLTAWLRDYVYIPLGGNRAGTLRTYANSILTMALAGLWHGAAWHFVVWGAIQGVLLSIERAAGIKTIAFRTRPLLYPLRMALTFAVWAGLLAIFRAPDLHQGWFALRQMFIGAPGESLLAPWHYGLVACALVLAILEESKDWFDRIAAGPVWAYSAVLAMCLAALELFSMTERSVPFFYFQF